MSDSSTGNRRPPKATRRSARQAAAQRRAQRQRMMTFAGIALAAAIVLAAVLIFVNRDDDASTDSGEAVAWSELPSDGRVLGDADAPVEFVVYSDFQCPFCKQFDEQDLPKVIENYVADGEVKVEWRPMPIISQAPLDSPDNESVQAAEAAMCAADQEQFWPYSEALYAAQGAENAGVYSDEMLKQTAADVGLDTAAFNECLDSGEKQEEVLALRQEGTESGVQGTPTFLINDQLVSYTLEGYDKLKDQLQDALDGNRVEG
jgi:protein-disulfide isomerase